MGSLSSQVPLVTSESAMEMLFVAAMGPGLLGQTSGKTRKKMCPGALLCLQTLSVFEQKHVYLNASF